MNKKSLLIAGIAAFAYHKYKNMSPESKKQMFDSLKGKVEEVIPANLRNLFSSIIKPAQDYKSTF